MWGREAVGLLLGMICVLAGVFGGTPSSVDADDDGAIDVAAGEVAIADNGKCSLQEAVANFNAQAQTWDDCPSGAGISVIRLAAGTYLLGGTKLPTINRTITFEGAGARSTIIDGASATAILTFRDASLTVAGLTLRNASGGLGGAIAVLSGTALTVHNTTFEDNIASKDGGAIYFGGNSLTITGSTFNGNEAARNGGAIGMPGGVSVGVVANSTFVNNTAKAGGAFAVTVENEDKLTVVNSTFSGNDATSSGTGFEYDIKTMVVKNSIVAKNGALHKSCTASTLSRASQYNLTDDTSCETSQSMQVTALSLGELDYHGGATKNFLPSEGSPAIDTGNDAICAAGPVNAIDQRGATRTGQGMHCDLGAIEVQTEPDQSAGALLTATMTVSGDFAPGGDVTYTVVLANAGDADQSDNPGPEFTDALPDGLLLLSASATKGNAAADLAAGTVDWDGAVARDAPVTITIHAQIVGDIGDTIANQAALAYDADGNGTNDEAGVSDDPGSEEAGDATSFVVTAPSVSAVMTTTTQAPYQPGDTITYQIVVRNDGNGAAQDVVVIDDVDSNSVLVEDSVITTAGAVVDGNGEVRVEIGSLGAGASANVTFNTTVVKPAPVGLSTVTNQATVSGGNFATVLTDNDANVSNGIAATTTSITTNPGLSVDISGPDNTTAGSTVTYLLHYANTGDIGLADVTLSASVPGSTAFSPASSTTGWACGIDTKCTMALGTLAGGSEGVVTFSVVVDDVLDAASLTLNAQIHSATTNASDSIATPIFAASLDATLDGPGIANPGDTVAYDLTVVNHGTADAAHVVVSALLPEGVLFSTSAGCSAEGQLVTCSLPSIDANEGQASLRINGALGPPVVDGTSLSMDASVTWEHASEPFITNTVTTTVEAVDLELSLTADKSTAAPGEKLAYTLDYGNQGSATATGAVATLSIPSGSTLAANESDTGWSCSAANVCSLAIGDVAGDADSSAILTVLLSDIADNAVSLTADASLSDDGTHGVDQDADDNRASATTRLIRPDLVVALSGPDETTPGGTFTYTATVTNQGEASASGFALADVLPTGLGFDSENSTIGCSAVEQSVTYTSDGLLPGGQVTFTIAVVVTNDTEDGAAITNAATVGRAYGESSTTDNTSPSVVTTVRAADLSVVASGAETARPGSAVSYTFEVTGGGSLTAEDAALTAHLADGLTFEPENSSAGCRLDGDAVHCALGALAGGESTTVSVAAIAALDVPDGTVLESEVSVDSSSPESSATLSDNGAVASTTITYLLDIQAAISAPATARSGEPITYSVTLTNVGNAGQVEFEDTFSAAVIVDSVVPAAGLTCSEPVGGAFECAGTLPGGGSATTVVTAHLDGSQMPGTFANELQGRAFTGQSESPVHEQVFSANATTTAERVIDVSISGRAIPSTALPGSVVTYKIVLANTGDALSDVVLTDVLPAGIEFDNVNAEGGFECTAGQTVMCAPADGRLGRDSTATIVVTAHLSTDADPGASLASAISLHHADGETSVSVPVTVAPPPPAFVIPQPPASPSAPSTQTHTYDLHYRWSLITWVGEDGVAPGSIVVPDGETQDSTPIAAIYSFDTESQGWRGYFPDATVGGANDLAALEFGQVYWVAIDGVEQANWTIPMGANQR
jgi:uncharacterized repeat protein (TIGR01451 family)